MYFDIFYFSIKIHYKHDLFLNSLFINRSSLVFSSACGRRLRQVFVHPSVNVVFISSLIAPFFHFFVASFNYSYLHFFVHVLLRHFYINLITFDNAQYFYHFIVCLFVCLFASIFIYPSVTHSFIHPFTPFSFICFHIYSFLKDFPFLSIFLFYIFSYFYQYFHALTTFSSTAHDRPYAMFFPFSLLSSCSYEFLFLESSNPAEKRTTVVFIFATRSSTSFSSSSNTIRRNRRYIFVLGIWWNS